MRGSRGIGTIQVTGKGDSPLHHFWLATPLPGICPFTNCSSDSMCEALGWLSGYNQGQGRDGAALGVYCSVRDADRKVNKKANKRSADGD